LIDVEVIVIYFVCVFVLIFYNDFEEPQRWGNFESGGTDARYYTGKYYHSDYASIIIRDTDPNGGTTSSMISDSVDVSTFNILNVTYFYLPKRLRDDDAWKLESSVDDGPWVDVKYWRITDDDISNNIWKQTSELIEVDDNNSIAIRITAITQKNSRRLYIDDVEVSGDVSQVQ